MYFGVHTIFARIIQYHYITQNDLNLKVFYKNNKNLPKLDKFLRLSFLIFLFLRSYIAPNRPSKLAWGTNQEKHPQIVFQEL